MNPTAKAEMSKGSPAQEPRQPGDRGPIRRPTEPDPEEDEPDPDEDRDDRTDYGQVGGRHFVP